MGLDPFRFKWVDETETTFNPTTHDAVDEDFVSFRIEQTEGNCATLSMDVRNPKVGLLAPGRKVWAWLSYLPEDTSGLTPLFFGRLMGVPTNLLQEVVTLSFIAKPLDFITQKFTLAETLMVRPWYDPVFIAEDKRPSINSSGTLGDADVVLEGYSALWHVDRTSLELTISDIIQGEDGTLTFNSGVPYDSVDISLNQPPLTSVQLVGDVNWGQKATGTIDFGTRSFQCWTGGSLISSWPKTGQQLAGGWSVNEGYATDVWGIGGRTTTQKHFSFENQEKTHRNGDPMSIQQTWTEFPCGGWMFISGLEQQAGFIPASQVVSYMGGGSNIENPNGSINVDNGTPYNPYAAIDSENTKSPIPLHMQYNQCLIANWLVNTKLVLDYQAGNTRKEKVLFVLSADLQSIVTLPDPNESVEQLTVSGADVGVGIDGVPPLTDTALNAYMPTDRGLWSLEYLIAVARAHLLARSRAVNVSWQCSFDEAVEFTCRKNATLYDGRLPGGVATGKISQYFLTCTGDEGTMYGGCTIACAIGHGGSVAATSGTPVYVEEGVLELGIQAYENQTVPLDTSDVKYTMPIVEPGGLIYPLTRDQVLVEERIDTTSETTTVQVGSNTQRWPNPGTTYTFATLPVTSYYLELEPVAGQTFAQQYDVEVSVLKVPKQIDLEAASI